MTQEELLMKIWDRVDYLNHEVTQIQSDVSQIQADLSWLKWLTMGIAIIIGTQAIGIIYRRLKNSK